MISFKRELGGKVVPRQELGNQGSVSDEIIITHLRITLSKLF
jgi:hypothetical protein